jgi:hypothetical protein
MAEADKIPKIDPAEVDLLIEKFEQNKLSDQDKRVITGLLRTLLYLSILETKIFSSYNASM